MELRLPFFPSVNDAADLSGLEADRSLVDKLKIVSQQFGINPDYVEASLKELPLGKKRLSAYMRDRIENDLHFFEFLECVGATAQQVQNVLKGAHVVFDDPNCFDQLKELVEQPYKRWHSHYKETGKESLGADGFLFRHVLMGKADKDGKPISWLQAERNGMRGLLDKVKHVADYGLYEISGMEMSRQGIKIHVKRDHERRQNIGPHGRTEHSDHNPLLVEVTPEETQKLAEYAEKQSRPQAESVSAVKGNPAVWRNLVNKSREVKPEPSGVAL